MIKPEKLNRGDTIAVVSLSSGLGGESFIQHRYSLGKQRMESEFGLKVIAMPNALKGIDYLDKHPEARAADLMNAFSDRSVKAVICMIGGDDTIRLLPYIDFDVIRSNPKIFMGYSDTTINHFMMRKAGIVSFYGPAVLTEFAENGAMHDYTIASIQKTLFVPQTSLPILPSPEWTSEFLDWAVAENNSITRKMQCDDKGFECIQGKGCVTGTLLGGCLDVLPMLIGTSLWPNLTDWNNTILFLETSEECVTPNIFRVLLRSLAVQGVFDHIRGILFAKPMAEQYYDEYNQILKKIVGEESKQPELPILSNINFGHNAPMCILPYGIKAEINCDTKSIRLLESAVEA